MLHSNAEVNVDGYETLWQQCVSSLEGELDSQIFNAYIKPLKFSEYKPEVPEFIVAAPSRFVCTQVENNFRDRLMELLRERTGNPKIVLSFLVDPTLASSTPRERPSQVASGPTAAAPQRDQGRYVVVKGFKQPEEEEDDDSSSDLPIFLMGTATLNPRYTFDNFVVGSSNQFCHAAAMRVAEKPGQSYNPLFIYGGVGLGKTHLLHSIGNEVLQKNPRANVAYMSSEAFTNELIQALRNAKMEEFKRKLRNIEVLLIDDIQFISGKERTQEEFFHTFNALYGAKRQIVITSDKIPTDIPGIEERLQTRFSWGLTADLQAPDFETRVAILNRKAVLEDFNLPEDVAHFIAEKVFSNVRELEGALTRLHALSMLQHIPINMKSAIAALQPLLQPKAVEITVDDIKSAVAEHFGLKVSDIISKRRTKNLSFPRHIAMYLCRKHTTASYPDIGQNFGGRDHSSVIHAASVVAGKIANDAEVREIVEEIERRIFEPF